MDEFSLWDQVRACLGCWRRPDVDGDDDLENGGSAGPELDRLLFESEHDTTNIEADVLSLHSDLGISRNTNVRRNRHSRRRGGGKAISVFGYNLFGRPRAPYLSPNHSEDESSALDPPPPQPRIPQSDPAPLDPDPAPISDAAIATLAPPHANAALAKWDAPLTDEQIALEEGRQREKEERMARRAARRLRKRQRAEAEAEVTADLAAGLEIPTPHDDVPQFEGFPGGNATLARDAVRPQFDSEENEYGPWVGNSQQQYYGEPHPPSTGDDDFEDDQVDVGGEYNRRSRNQDILVQVAEVIHVIPGQAIHRHHLLLMDPCMLFHLVARNPPSEGASHPRTTSLCRRHHQEHLMGLTMCHSFQSIHLGGFKVVTRIHQLRVHMALRRRHSQLPSDLHLLRNSSVKHPISVLNLSLVMWKTSNLSAGHELHRHRK